MIEVGDYKLYRLYIGHVRITAVIKVDCFFGKPVRLIESIPHVSVEAEDVLAGVLLAKGRLCDSYMSKKNALIDLHRIG